MEYFFFPLFFAAYVLTPSYILLFRDCRFYQRMVLLIFIAIGSLGAWITSVVSATFDVSIGNSVTDVFSIHFYTIWPFYLLTITLILRKKHLSKKTIAFATGILVLTIALITGGQFLNDYLQNQAEQKKEIQGIINAGPHLYFHTDGLEYYHPSSAYPVAVGLEQDQHYDGIDEQHQEKFNKIVADITVDPDKVAKLTIAPLPAGSKTPFFLPATEHISSQPDTLHPNHITFTIEGQDISHGSFGYAAVLYTTVKSGIQFSGHWIELHSSGKVMIYTTNGKIYTKDVQSEFLDLFR